MKNTTSTMKDTIETLEKKLQDLRDEFENQSSAAEEEEEENSDAIEN